MDISFCLKNMRPAETGSAPDTRLKRVVFPAPLGPIRPKTSPSRTSRLTPSRALSPPKILLAWFTSRNGDTIFPPQDFGPPLPRESIFLDQPFMADQHDHHEHEAIDQKSVFGQETQKLGGQGEEHCADDRADESL